MESLIFLTRFIILEISNFSDINRRTFIRERERNGEENNIETLYTTPVMIIDLEIDRDSKQKIVTCYALFRAKNNNIESSLS